MSRDWYISRSDLGWEAHLTEVPWHVRTVVTAWTTLCKVTNGRLGGHGKMPRWAWKIPTGWPKWDRDDEGRYLENSLAWGLYSLESALFTWEESNTRTLAVLDISESTAEEISPQEFKDWAYDKDEDEDAA